MIIFDEIQLNPQARQAIKHLVADGRYNYIETGSLISIKKNIQGIVIPSEEYRIQVYPMDYEEFMWAIGNDTYDVLRNLYELSKPVGDSLNRKLMRDFRIYMAVGGLSQAVKAYVEGKNFTDIDAVKRGILDLYKDDFKRVDGSGLIGQMFESIPSQLATDKKRYVISNATEKNWWIRILNDFRICLIQRRSCHVTIFPIQVFCYPTQEIQMYSSYIFLIRDYLRQ